MKNLLYKFSSKQKSEASNANFSYMYELFNPVWSGRNYHNFAKEAYCKNVIANRCINIIAQGATSVPWRLFRILDGKKFKIDCHPLLDLLLRPNPLIAGAEFFDNAYAYKMISGNAFILSIMNDDGEPVELHILRPDRVTIIPGKNGMVKAYKYEVDNQSTIYPVDQITGQSQILHLRQFHPLDDYYGLSSIEAASYSIDQHNQAAKWNQALLQNGARPSGALIVKNDNQVLSDLQFNRLRDEINENFAGAKNSGKPLLLEGGIDWREMSLSPRDMDFIEAKNSSARDIALAFGVPPQLLGIPGDNTYSNMQEARLALWEETILPLLDDAVDALNHWLTPMFGCDLKLCYEIDEISALSVRREQIWNRIENASFLTSNEKRQMIGLAPLPE